MKGELDALVLPGMLTAPMRRGKRAETSRNTEQAACEALQIDQEKDHDQDNGSPSLASIYVAWRKAWTTPAAMAERNPIDQLHGMP